MLSSLLLVVLTQVACTPGEMSAVCSCKQGMVSACVTLAGDEEWHRKVDEEVVEWLKEHPKATLEQFMNKLREIYSRPEMQSRFPHGF